MSAARRTRQKAKEASRPIPEPGHFASVVATRSIHHVAIAEGTSAASESQGKIGLARAVASPHTVSGATTGATSMLAGTPQIDPVSVNRARTGRQASCATRGTATSSASRRGAFAASRAVRGSAKQTMPSVALAESKNP